MARIVVVEWEVCGGMVGLDARNRIPLELGTRTFNFQLSTFNHKRRRGLVAWHNLLLPLTPFYAAVVRARAAAFAGGWLIYVSSSVNLLDVAVAFSQDDKEQVSKWLTSGDVAKVTDEQAKQWHEANTTFWSTVVKPWVLIQPVIQSKNNAIH